MNTLTHRPARWMPHAVCARGVLIALTCAVSLSYAVTQAATDIADALPIHLGVAVGVAALAWCGLFGLTWALSPVARRLPRFDWCLWTVTVGSVFMLAWLALSQSATVAGIDPDLTRWGPLLGLATANVAMAWFFTRYAPTVAVRRRDALLIWIGGMNGLLTLGLVLGTALFGDAQ